MRHLSANKASALVVLYFCLVTLAPAAAQSPINQKAKPAKMEAKVDAELFFKHLPENFLLPRDEPGNLLLREYGSMLVAGKGVQRPLKVFFQDETDVAAFQAKLKRSTHVIGGITLELQSAAMEELVEALAEARSAGLTISPRGADSARRGYQQTV